ncbi:MAG: mechanosensitive ion channel family protein [Nocardioidaceae bacterium]
MADVSCSSNDHWCTIVDDLTHNDGLARAADWLIARPLSILALLVIGYVVRWLLHRLIGRLAHRAAIGTVPGVLARGKIQHLFPDTDPQAVERRQLRADTMASLLKSIATAVIATIVLFMVIAQLGYNIAPLIASAGIIGVALGFGAQSLVKDFLSGIFMILEDQYGVGDAVNVGLASGTIEAVGLRVTRMRDISGTVWYVRNGEILAVGNMSQSWARVVLDVPVSFSADLERVHTLLNEAAHELWQDPDFEGLVIEEPEVWGVERWDPDGVVVRLVLKTAPDEQGPVAREMRARIKARFDAEGIEIPLPQRMVWHRDSPEPPS